MNTAAEIIWATTMLVCIDCLGRRDYNDCTMKTGTTRERLSKSDQEAMALIDDLRGVFPIDRISDDELTEVVWKTLKNVSIRPTTQQARSLIYLKLKMLAPMASVVKTCLDRGLRSLVAEMESGKRN